MMLADRLGPQGDTFYAKLMEAHEGLSEADSHRLNARLVLILANEIGDAGRLADLIDVAAQGAKDTNA